MARQPNRTLQGRRVGLCAVSIAAFAGVLAVLNGSTRAQLPPPIDGPMLSPTGTSWPATSPATTGNLPNNPPTTQYLGAPAPNYPPPNATGQPTAVPNYGVNPAYPPYSPQFPPANPPYPAANPAGPSPPGGPNGAAKPGYPLPSGEETVVEVRVDGNRTVATHKIMGQIHTRAGRPYNVQSVQDDVRALMRMGLFVTVEPHILPVPGGVIVIFRVAERPLLQAVEIIGNDTYQTKALKREAEVKSGDAADPYAVENGRRKIEEFYKKHGYSKVRVTVLEGSKPGDLRVIYSVDEGPRQRVLWINFVGATFVSGHA